MADYYLNHCLNYKTVECARSFSSFLSEYQKFSGEDYEQNKFGKPMLWIGIYVAAASLICTLAMAVDVFLGFRHRKLWFPCKFFTLNAASLTLLAVAMKLPVDLTAFMNNDVDRLAKLSSTAFLCTVMGNFMTSLGPMNSKEILMNLIALAILVITVLVNLCIQLLTGAITFTISYWDDASIYIYSIGQLTVMVCIFVLLVIWSVSALTVPISKTVLQNKYHKMHKITSNEDSKQSGKLTVEKLKDNVKKYWIMAETSSPQFVMARSATSSASGAICFLIVPLLVAVYIKAFSASQPSMLLYLDPGSDYKWSTVPILWIQTIGVVVGTIAPTFRWFTVVSLKCLKKGSNDYRNEFKVENYWIQMLLDWKKPSAIQIQNRKCKRLVEDTKGLILNFCIVVHIIVVILSKTVCVVSIFIVRTILSCCCYCKLLKRKLISKHSASNSDRGSKSELSTEQDFNRYVLQLDGEEELPKRILKNISDDVDRWIKSAQKQQPKNLMALLEKSTSFKGVAEFDSDQVLPLLSEEPSNCWSLPVITLTSIIIALPNMEKNIIDRLLCSVGEGLSYISIIEKSLDTKGHLENILTETNVMWLDVELYRKWLYVDLKKMALKGKTSKENIQRLADIAKKNVIEFKRNINDGLEQDPLHWPVKVIAANSMYRISQTILLDYQGSNNQTDEQLFEKLSVMIADILWACLTNLPHVITTKCFCNATKKREESLRLATRLLGETEEILKILQQRELPNLEADQVANMDEWRSLLKQKNPSTLISSSVNETTSLDYDAVHIEVK